MTESYPEPKRSGRPPKAYKPADDADVETITPEPMSTAPRDGKPLWLTANGSTWVRGVWRKTRAIDYDKRRFVPTGFWVLQNSTRRLDFEPTGWHELTE
jgi:hypothetical protein